MSCRFSTRRQQHGTLYSQLITGFQWLVGFQYERSYVSNVYAMQYPWFSMVILEFPVIIVGYQVIVGYPWFLVRYPWFSEWLSLVFSG